ncbi:MAG: alpha/beta fold hydrolase [Bdellovibrio sp.]
MKLVVLAGFLGTAGDFEAWLTSLEAAFAEKKMPWFEDVKIIAVSEDPAFAPEGTWLDWTRSTLEDLDKWAGTSRVFAIGYSLGGRLLLSLADSKPDFFSKLVLMSAHPGLPDPAKKSLTLQESAMAAKERATRRAQDEAWSRKFIERPWPNLMTEWQAQGVFKDSVQEPERQERTYSRVVLAQLLTTFSLAAQPDYREAMRAWPVPQFWLAGERDAKFLALLTGLADLKADTIRCGIVPEASHRIFLDNPRFTSRRVAEFFRSSSRD